MPTHSLQDFIAHARKKGMDHQTIRMLLLANGWKEKDIAQALTEEALDMPVPMPTDSGGAREAFFHLLAFASFYTTAISLIILFFTYINRLFPDAAVDPNYYYRDTYNLSGIRWSLAAIIVAFPLYLWLNRFLLKEMAQHRERAWSGIRRWLTYLTLFVAATTIMGDVITLVFNLLEGEISIRFIMKVFIILFIAGLSFTYYFLSLKLPIEKKKTKDIHRVFGGIAIATVLIALVWGIWLAGSPMSERQMKFDERRIEDLRAIDNEVRTISLGQTRYREPAEFKLEQPLPKTLQEVKEKAVQTIPNIIDPETQVPYRYEVLSETGYRLCATFNAPREQQFDIFWNHGAGEKCYELDVRKNIF